MAAYFNETLIPAWITWKKVDEIAHEEKEEIIIDFSLGVYILPNISSSGQNFNRTYKDEK